MRTALATILAIAIVVIFGSAAFADDWIVVRLRGSVYQHVDGEWVRLQRGGMVPDSRVVRTMKTGNVEFQRGNETVTIGPDTQIQIFDERTSVHDINRFRYVPDHRPKCARCSTSLSTP